MSAEWTEEQFKIKAGEAIRLEAKGYDCASEEKKAEACELYREAITVYTGLIGKDFGKMPELLSRILGLHKEIIRLKEDTYELDDYKRHLWECMDLVKEGWEQYKDYNTEVCIDDISYVFINYADRIIDESGTLKWDQEIREIVETAKTLAFCCEADACFGESRFLEYAFDFCLVLFRRTGDETALKECVETYWDAVAKKMLLPHRTGPKLVEALKVSTDVRDIRKEYVSLLFEMIAADVYHDDEVENQIKDAVSVLEICTGPDYEELAEVYRKAGEFYLAKNESKIADKYLKKAIELLEDSLYLDTAGVRAMLAMAYCDLVEGHECRRNLKKAENAANQSYKYSSTRALERLQTKEKLKLAERQLEFSMEYQFKDDIKTVEFARRAYEILNSVAKESLKMGELVQYLRVNNRVVDQCKYVEGGLDIAKKAIYQSIAILENKNPEAGDLCLDLLLAYDEAVQLHEKMQDWQEAVEMVLKRISLMDVVRKLQEEQPENEQIQSVNCEIHRYIYEYRKIIALLIEDEDFAQAEMYCEKSMQLIEQNTTEDIDELKADIYANYGDIYKYRGDVEGAIEYYRKGLDTARNISNPYFQIRHIRFFCLAIGKLLDEKGLEDKALEYFGKAVDDVAPYVDKVLAQGEEEILYNAELILDHAENCTDLWQRQHTRQELLDRAAMCYKAVLKIEHRSYEAKRGLKKIAEYRKQGK